MVEALGGLEFPLVGAASAPSPASVQRWTPTIEALYVPDIDASLDEQAAKRPSGRRSGRSATGTRPSRPDEAAAGAAVESLATPLKALAALAVGWPLANLVSTPGELVALALIAAGVDAVSVAAGPSRSIVEDGSGAFERVAIHLPPWDTQALLGPVDIVFLGLFVACAARVGMRTGATAVATLTGLVIAVGAALGTGAGLPAIPFMAAGLILVNLDRLGRS